MKALKNKKIVSVLLTMSVIMILLLTGPASAVRLGLNFDSGDNPEITKGETLGFTVSADLEKINEKDELINENSAFIVEISKNGESVAACSFDLQGNRGECNSSEFPTIVANNNAEYIDDGDYYLYGYGFGYGYGLDNSSRYQYLNDTYSDEYGSGAGYGYMPRYDYTTEPYGELSYDLSWKTSTTGSYEMTVLMQTPTGTNNVTNKTDFFVFELEESKSFTVASSDDPDDPDDTPDSPSPGGPGEIPPTDDTEENATVPAYQNILDNVIANKNVPEDVKEKLTTIAEKLKNILPKGQTDVFVGDEIKNLGNIMQLQEMMGTDDIESVMVNELDREDRSLGDMPEEIKESVLQKLKEKGNNKFLFDRSDVKKKTKVTTVTTNDGETKSLVDVTYEVSTGDHVVEVPKTLAATASEIQGVFEVIEEDPILLFEGTETIEMGFATDVDKVEALDSEADNVRIASLEEDQPVEAISTPDEGNQTVPPTDDTGFGVLVGVLLLIVIIGAVAVVVYSRTRGNKPDFEVK